MIKTTKLLAAVMAFILLSSFTDKHADEFVGTYGVSSSDPAQIKLTINSDHTFIYQDFSVADKKIVVSGNWIQKGQKIVLNSLTSDEKFHNVWSFVENGQVAKSRKGFSYYRLCKIDEE